ncbi:carboxypeptidase-like regulatory domain-containing protein [Flavobacterium pectinovorum]|uniref:CarboxypepD_reg-like domain-containing protein n=1 Tax=Flavobacterium pectinovorum TaxID=29533 RepID=A0A502EQR3_9FLAO|nr:carboxypeptidase-like regulatory domain-containing protein [Flavobacterium pectinovorum]TPG38840.1 hypothetical protein EAH81_15290 [Flavobacterium pectinovorum]
MKTMIRAITIILLFSLTTVFSQETTIKGFVLDNLKKPIRYANVGILNKPIGTVTNNEGEFILKIDASLALDTLKISSLGFKSTEFIIKNLLDNKITDISLESHIEELEEVVISTDNLKRYTEGKEKTKSKNQVFFANPEIKNINLGSQIGRKFILSSKKPSILEELKFYIKENNYEKIKFRINIYSVHNEIPTNRINKIDIYSEVQNIKGWVNVSLTDYNIVVKDDVIVTVEWIEASKTGDILSLPLLIPSFNSVHYYKQSAQSQWKKYKMISSAMLLTYKQ